LINTLLQNFVSQFEGCRLTAYQDAGGVWTVGYGETGPHVRASTVISQDEADAMLSKSLRKAADCVRRYVEVALSETQQAALTSLVFNIGCGAFRKSTLLGLLNAGNYNGLVDKVTVGLS
jgi:lysozyme